MLKQFAVYILHVNGSNMQLKQHLIMTFFSGFRISVTNMSYCLLLAAHCVEPAAKEEMVSRIFAKHGLRLDIEVSVGHVGSDRSYPYIKVSSLVEALDRHRKLFKLLGMGREFDTLEKCEAPLLDFWENIKS